MKKTIAGDSGDLRPSRLFDSRHVRGNRVQAARKSGEVAALVCQKSAEAMIVTDADNRVLAINPAFTLLTGFTAREVVGRPAEILAGGSEAPVFYRRLWEAIDADGHWQGELSDRRKNGEIFTASINLNTIYHEDQSVKLRVVLLSDLTGRRKDASGARELFRHVNQAMHAAKNAGQNSDSYYSKEFQAIAQRRMRLTGDLHGALAGRQFKLYFQPIVDLASDCIRKAEALIRWEHPTLGMISPEEFIPLAEATGLIVQIGEWVFLESAHNVKRLRETYHPAFQISVNVSPVQLRNDDDLARKWLDYLAELQLHPTSMTIEITEGVLLEVTPEITEKLGVLREAGIQVSLDDFGTGYSSLAYLKQIDLDYLKIDQSFVRDLDNGHDDKALCEAIVLIAHKLGLKVIAEGVETATQRDFLFAVDCDFAQGYLFSKPVSADAFDALLTSTNRLTDSGMSRQFSA